MRDTSKLLVVVPVLDTEWARPCIESALMPGSSAGWRPEQMLIVDNTRDGDAKPEVFDVGHRLPKYYRDPDGHNLGTSRAWNIGARKVLSKRLDYLVILSASMLFGPMLHTTWVEQMARFWGENVIEVDGHSWHFICFHRRVFQKVGLFDENLYPAYVEGLDFSYRMRQVGWEGGWRRAWVNVLSRGVAWHVRQDPPLVSCPFAPLNDYMVEKWGGPKGEETFTLPFGDRPLDYWPRHSIPELAAKYGLETWW